MWVPLKRSHHPSITTNVWVLLQSSLSAKWPESASPYLRWQYLPSPQNDLGLGSFSPCFPGSSHTLNSHLPSVHPHLFFPPLFSEDPDVGSGINGKQHLYNNRRDFSSPLCTMLAFSKYFSTSQNPFEVSTNIPTSKMRKLNLSQVPVTGRARSGCRPLWKQTLHLFFSHIC